MTRKRIILVAAAFLLGLMAFWVFSSGDRPVQRHAESEVSGRVRQFVSRPTTQATQTISDADMTFSPGEMTLVRVYDEVSGRLKYVFEAKSWEPISQVDFHLRDLQIQIFMPRGEITYINADEAQVTLARKARSRVDPRRGWLKGNVRVMIDRTTSAWREANPHLADRFAHPDDLINIHLPEAKFDMDRAELTADGDVTVDSIEARIENVRGLTLQWDQVDNRIDVLRFDHGGTMALRRGGGMVDFALPGTTRSKRKDKAPKDPAAAKAAIAAQFKVPRAQVMKPMRLDEPTADEAATEIRVEGGVAAANRPMVLADSEARGNSPAGTPTTTSTALRDPNALVADVERLRTEAKAGASGEVIQGDVLETVLKKSGPKVHTYRAIFQNSVVVEQKDGLRTLNKIESDKLEINFDFGKKQRNMTTARAPQNAKPEGAAAPDGKTPQSDRQTPIDAAPDVEDNTKLVLTWDGPLELRPLRVDPAEQTGQRFDAIATGKIVKLKSEQGSGSCTQLVYRHERKQVWLSGDSNVPVQLDVSASQRLTGREIFFDQRRGLGRIDGGGRMIDERLDGVTALGDSAAGSGREKKQRDPVDIRWSRGVDLEVGAREVESINPATGLKEAKNREYLRRAWFHGDVAVVQGDEQLNAQEVAVTFGLPAGKDEVADHIQHLNMSGAVKLLRADELIAAERLDVEMTLTPEGRNIPRIVDAAGNVLAQQGKREVRAGQMHVVMGQTFPPEFTAPDGRKVQPKPRLGMESIDASENIYINDPDQNLLVSKAQTLKATMRDGNRLVRATILGHEPARYARARYDDTEIQGHRIEIDVEGQAVDVPGPGGVILVTNEDFGGRKLSEPTPVKTTWRDYMQFRVAQDYGVFVGEVHSASDTFALNCDKLTVRFSRVPPPPTKAAKPFESRGFWTLGTARSYREGGSRVQLAGAGRASKRPSYIVAEGHAEALSSEFVDTGGEAGAAIDQTVPLLVRGLQGSPLQMGVGKLIELAYAEMEKTGVTSTVSDARGPLEGRARIASDQIAVDLVAQQMSVPGRGTLLLEDYKFDKKRERSGTLRDDSGPALMNAMRSDGPSQTLVAWENSMDYFVDRNLVAFDRAVSMVHRSGQEMVLKGKLAAAMNLDVENLKHLSKGRKASLSCGNLLLEFGRGFRGGSGSTQPIMSTADLDRLIARGAVHFQEDTKSLMGEHLQYLREINEIRIEGSDRLEARIVDQDEPTQRLSMWKGPILIWDRKTNRIEAPRATIRTSRR
ncbi:MAG TPA: hypothetical protein VJZ71_21420 [Phycisphaerae bacterium]|nr:hypothetical protein [Phycisphaerae bacterium]